MSCFTGKLTEYPNISVDCFDKNNFDSNVYFLSHCHQDHMNGLNSTAFHNRLKGSSSTLIYCSEVTKNILLCDSKYKHLEDYLVGLAIEQSTNISVLNDITGEVESLCVTLLSAGHCIGSVMFLFEGNNGTVLYTGDFRLSKGDVSRIPAFNCGDSVKEITSIYVDTTFCLPQMDHIPSREETREAVLNLIKKWLINGDNYYISLLCKGMYGYEYLLKEVAMALKTKIHVSKERLELYRNLYDMKDYFTTDPKMTKIHSCNWNRDRHSFSTLPCGLLLPAPQQIKVLKIKPSSMWFARRKEPLPQNCVVNVSADFYRVVHSMHASMEEVVDLVKYLRPLRVFPTVEPAGRLTIKQAQKSLEQFTRCSNKTEQSDSNKAQFEEQATVPDETPAKCQSSLFSIKSLMNGPSKEVLDQCNYLGLLNDVPNEVPRRRRRRNTAQNNINEENKNEEIDNSTLTNKRECSPENDLVKTHQPPLNSGRFTNSNTKPELSLDPSQIHPADIRPGDHSNNLKSYLNEKKLSQKRKFDESITSDETQVKITACT